VREKGFEQGLWELLRPFGDRVQGKVTIRDSNGSSKSWEDFAVRFTRFGENIEYPQPVAPALRTNGQSTLINASESEKGSVGTNIAEVEKLVDRHLSYAEDSYLGLASPTATARQGLEPDATSPYYALYIRRMLSGIPLSPHETFSHPVVCVIAISSRNPTPIESLRRLYAESTTGSSRLPEWVYPEYLRYYVLVHDEEKSDITKSLALFDSMKRHLGLHCHLLRLRSSQSAETDDDSIPMPKTDWLTAAEELALIERGEEQGDLEEQTRYIFDSDATAIRAFVREMVTQSVIPTLERLANLWNEQVVSRRKGIGGRLVNLSKRWAGFGGGARSGSAAGPSSSSNYDAAGFYRPDTPEALMRKLADFAFMLRDWKLAMSTYDLVRGDFGNDKAWRYQAAANEMAALSLLIMPRTMSSRSQVETVNGMLDSAFYSYLTRCSAPFPALRSIVLGLELLRLRGGSGVDEAVRWGIRLLESRIAGPVGDALLRERMAICYAAKEGVGSGAWGSRRRKSALWSVLAAQTWVDQTKYIQAQRCLNEARKMYSMLPGDDGIDNFVVARDFMAQLQARLKEGLTVGAGGFETGFASEGTEMVGEEAAEEVAEFVEEPQSLALDRRRSRRDSLLNPASTPPRSGFASAEDTREKPTEDGFE
jgi:trafficking protein particle complex subunit 8